ncbi:nucleotidyltransferase domain-containing protein [Actinospica durhamensis]|uniref:Nucleotidyltransferase domain-containing protein n=1 Tax=Actinospica durhamensis TaxID=1508375 RepID=A0A941EVK3_9ACTN|nr:nucleotidyltransferase domain-containing protein [Actinospica durhamensis]MBR7839090.1 nucleotidyltransferase domain-containing protein [Actinospica durhamensis]
MDQDPVIDARALVEELFPQARWAVLAGSVITAHRTAGSDLEIVVLLPTGDPQAPHRDSRHFRGWPVESFVHDEQTLAHYLAKELRLRKPSLHRMVARSVVLVGDPSRWRAECDGALADGPAPLTAAEHDYARYGLTDLLDDLAHAVDPGEKTVIAATAWTAAAQQALAFDGRWAGNGKWLLRELRELDRGLADRWLAAFGDPEAIDAVAREVLDRAGGPLFDGFRAAGERPSG